MTSAAARTHGAASRVSERAVVARTAAITLSAAVACLWVADPDLWGHLRFGLDAIRDRALTSVDPYSFTSDVPWTNHEWLSEVAMGAAYLAGGVPGLLALKVLLIGSAFALLMRRARDAPAPARWWILAAAAALTSPVVITMRPQLWTVLFLAVVTTTSHWSPKRLVFLWPVIFALWANLHGGWIVGVGVVGAWVAGTAIDTRDWRLVSRLVGLWCICAVSTLATPYGFELWRFIDETVGLNRNDITEWRGVWIEGTIPWIGGLVLTGVLLRRASWAWAAVLPVLMLGVGSAKVARLSGLWVVVAVGLLLPRWRALVPTPRFPAALTAIITAFALLPAGFLAVKESRCVTVRGWRGPDVEAAGALRTASGRLMVSFGWGQFAIWHFAPRLKVSFDGRRETVYSAQRIAEQHGLTAGDLSLAPFIQREHPEYVWVPRPQGETLARHLATLGYRTDIQTGKSIILVRQDLPVLTPAAMSPCFP